MKLKLTTVTILGIAGIGIFAAPDLARANQYCGVQGCVEVDRNPIEDTSERLNRIDNNFQIQIQTRLSKLYYEVLGRSPDPRESRIYGQRMLNDGHEKAIRRDLARSQEARETIDRIYREEIGSNADRDTLSTYQKHLENGWSLKKVRDRIRRNSEDRHRR